MPPQAGFVSEWYMFETVFQGFRLDTLPGRLVMALAGAGLALTVAVAFATYVKVFGIGLLGRRRNKFAPVPAGYRRCRRPAGAGRTGACGRHAGWLDALRRRRRQRIRHAGRARHARRAVAGAADREIRLHLADPAGHCHAAAWPSLPIVPGAGEPALRRSPRCRSGTAASIRIRRGRRRPR